MFKDFKKDKTGFTLVELIISMAIFGIIVVLSISNYRGGARGDALRLGAIDMASVIRKAQFLSFTGRVADVGGPVKDVPAGGYGVRIETCATFPCTYKIFADFDGQLNYNGVTEDVEREQYDLPSRVVVDSITSPLLGAVEPADVVFKPPVPYVCINGDCSNVGRIEITLRHLGDNRTIKVVINQESAQVSIEE